MKNVRWIQAIQRLFLLILPLTLFTLFLFPQHVSAHAILVRADPVQDSVLDTPPTQVRMWFSETLNPTFSTAYVVNANTNANAAQNDIKGHVDTGDVHVSSSDNTEMDLSLKADLPGAVYLVLYRTQSADDGHILHGSYLFTVKETNGTVPTFNGQIPGQNVVGASNTNGQLDASALFSLLMVTLVDLGAVFWVGAQFWLTFVPQARERQSQEQQELSQHIEQRFALHFALPALGIILLANIGVLVGQALTITNGDWGQALAPQILLGLISNGQFGTYWIIREVVTLLAIALAIYARFVARPPQFMQELASWSNFILGLALLAAITLSGHAAATSNNVLIYAILSDFLHLIAASLWIGGMMFIASIYLPVIRVHPLIEQARALLIMLPRYSPLAIVGVIIMTLSGPLNATTRMDSWNQLINTAYGRTLLVKVLLVGMLLITSAIHVFVLRPRLSKVIKEYHSTNETLQNQTDTAPAQSTPMTSPQFKVLEDSVIKRTRKLRTILRWEPVLGIAVLLCTGLLTVFSGTLQPATVTAPVQKVVSKDFTTTLTTTDNKFKLKLDVNPNHFGLNTFTVTVTDSNGQTVPSNEIGVSIYTTMLDMDMGTQQINLQPDGKGHFSAAGELGMGGNWEARIEIRMLDNTVHGAKIDFVTPF